MDYTNPANLIIAGIYFIITGIITFFSIFSVYILIRYGKSRNLSLVFSIIYSMFFIGLLEHSYSVLQSIR